jgi:tetratricopeptide (TPR) repeat protein
VDNFAVEHPDIRLDPPHVDVPDEIIRQLAREEASLFPVKKAQREVKYRTALLADPLWIASVPLQHLHRGKAYASLGQFEEAIEDFNNAIGLDSGWADPYFARAEAYESIGRPEEARRDRETWERLQGQHGHE